MIRLAAAAIVLLAALLPSGMLAWRSRAMPQLGIIHDDSIYVVTAKSLAEGNGYRIASLPDQPHQTKYPPLFPLLLSLAWRWEPVFPATLPGMMLLTWGMLPACVFLTWRLLREAGLSLLEATAIAAWIAINPVAVMFSTIAMSELMSLALLLAAIVLAERALRGEGRDGIALLAGLLGGAAFLTRSAALPLLVSAPAVLLLGGKRKRAVMFAVGMLPAVAGWQVWSATHRVPAPDMATLFYTDYIGYYLRDVTLGALPSLVWINVGAITTAIAELLVFDEEITTFTLTVSRLLAAAVVVGAVRLYRRGVLRHYTAFAALYLLQFLFWNYPLNSRFLLPLLPLVAVAAYTEARHLMRIVATAFAKPKWGDRLAAVAIGALLAALGLYAAGCIWFGLKTAVPSLIAGQQRALESTRPAREWLARNTPPESRVLAYADPVMYLYTGRRGMSVRVPPSLLLEGNRSAIERYFAELPNLVWRHGMDFVVLTPGDYQFDGTATTLPAWRAAVTGGVWTERAFDGGQSAVFRVKR